MPTLFKFTKKLTILILKVLIMFEDMLRIQKLLPHLNKYTTYFCCKQMLSLTTTNTGSLTIIVMVFNGKTFVREMFFSDFLILNDVHIYPPEIIINGSRNGSVQAFLDFS